MSWDGRRGPNEPWWSGGGDGGPPPTWWDRTPNPIAQTAAAHDGMAVGPYDDPHRYVLHQRVSAGSEGVVWRASVSVDGNPLPVAVKVIADAHLGDLERWRERWSRQAELLRSLDHPALVRVREVFEGPTPGGDSSTRSLYLVMNWANGVTLTEWLEARPRSAEERVVMIDAIGAAVAYLHSGIDTNNQPVLHRDLKPSNVIVDGDLPRLVDFGFVRFGGQDATMVGTAGYIAPEVAAGIECTSASDLYSLGAMAFTVLTGHKLGLTDLQDPARAIDQHPDLAGWVGLGSTVAGLLHADPASRPRQVPRFAPPGVEGPGNVRALRGSPVPADVLDGTTIIRRVPESVTDMAATEEMTTRRRGPAAAIILAVAAVVGGGIGVLVALGGWGPSPVPAPPPTTAAAGTSVARSTTTSGSTTLPPPTLAAVAMPPTTGRQVEAARVDLTAVGAHVSVIELDDRTEQFGIVITQSIAAGTPIVRGEKVTLQISGHFTHMPKVERATLAGAQAQILNAGFTLAPQVVPAAPVDENARVGDQSIEAGARVERSSVITLTMEDSSHV